ncbi:NAD(P)/FAD-dependent oxidoreductase [Thaumasiovibrio subtropicus]|uniref:NAD(P)/FAD-dependent oxidoreductase n=1 Tax=Thaumasiovibrio subtropicus TaxID=1891207 RepID=UPI000B354E5C|nr:NAD(P)/FAD-dependent oxidoreductase [Thaumasiovibrio subtropicus]
MKETSVVIVGAGPAGLGCAALLKQMGIQDKDMRVFEASTIGSSFEAWPKEMRMITPSFPSNGYHQTDLNAITPDTSPAFSLHKEHPSGVEYAQYLRNVVRHYDINVDEQTRIVDVAPHSDEGFWLKTATGDAFHCQYLIWATGEYAAPRLNTFKGSELCIHNGRVDSWDNFNDDHYAVIGTYESGVDAAYNLAIRGKRVTLIEAGDDEQATYDPSRVLSPYTSERLASMANMDLVDLEQGFKVIEVRNSGDHFELISETGDLLTSSGQPINCTGFDTYLGPASELFDVNAEGFPQVNTFDESTLHRNLFLAGPKLVHGNNLLCFIYKFRGRFATPCSVIGAELELDTSILRHYQQAGMLLDDFTCCEAQECFC